MSIIERTRFAISTLENAKKNMFSIGPALDLRIIMDYCGDKGDFIFKLKLDEDPIPIRKWSDKKQKWVEKYKQNQ